MGGIFTKNVKIDKECEECNGDGILIYEVHKKIKVRCGCKEIKLNRKSSDYNLEILNKDIFLEGFWNKCEYKRLL